MKLFLILALGFVLVGSALSLVYAIHQDIPITLHPAPVTSPLILDRPAQSSPSLILSDQFSIDGTGGKSCDQINQAQINADRKYLNAGLIRVSFTANQSVNFWFLNPSQYSAWSAAVTCPARLAAPSILTLASRLNYSNNTILIPRTDDYYFVFDNTNAGGVTVSLVVDYPPTMTTTLSRTILNKQFILRGVKEGCTFNSYNEAAVKVEAGRLTASFSSTGPVDFWILDQTQYARWSNDPTCRPSNVQSVFTQFHSNAYDGVTQFNSTNTYYFTFVTFNEAPVFITLTVGYPKSEVSTTTSQFANILQGLPVNTSQLQQVLGALATGGSVIIGWFFKTRKRRFLTGYLTKIDDTYNQYATNRVECKKALENMKAEILRLLKTGKIDEAHFTILEEKIARYLTEIR